MVVSVLKITLFDFDKFVFLLLSIVFGTITVKLALFSNSEEYFLFLLISLYLSWSKVSKKKVSLVSLELNTMQMPSEQQSSKNFTGGRCLLPYCWNTWTWGR